jgi:peptide/nickel transport system permease protein
MIELRRLATNPPLVIGLTGVIALLIIGIFGTMLAPFDPNAGGSLIWRVLPDGNTTFQVPPTLPDPDHLLGTDSLGRDQWSRILAGAKLTLMVVLAAMLVRLGIGFGIGITSGWYGGVLSKGLTVIAKGIAAFPQLLLAIMLVLATKQFGVLGFIASLALVGWPEVAEFVRGEVILAKAQPFMEAARSIGAPGRRLIRTHLVTALGPHLLSIAALESSAVLLLLAELGLLGLFLSGATFLVGDFGPLGLKERAPEWGQMLGTIQWVAILFQLGTLVPALFVVAASATFALLADGLRAASDPFSSHRLLPGTFGIMTKALIAAMCFSSVGLLAANVQTTALTMEQGRELAAKTAQATWPGSVYVAGVARYLSYATQLTRPDRLTYYYRNLAGEVLRISYVNADRLGVEVRQYETEDDIDFSNLRVLPAGLASYDRAITGAEAAGGADFRQGLDNYLIRAIVTWPPDHPDPVYSVTYGTSRRGELTLLRFCCVDARTGAPIGTITKS